MEDKNSKSGAKHSSIPQSAIRNPHSDVPHSAFLITIDGPAGAGKSTVARALAERLGFDFLDTGALYRALTLAAIREESNPIDDERALVSFLANLHIELSKGRTFLGGQDVSAEIRTAEVTERVRYFAESALVREKLDRLQRACAEGRDLVTEGRDQGTVVFPDANCKFFLTANPSERARRRHADFVRQGRQVTLEEVLAEHQERDQRDQNRFLAPLEPAKDARIVDSTDLDFTATVDLLERLVREPMRQGC